MTNVIFMILISLLPFTKWISCLDPQNIAEEEIKNVINKYINNIPDIESRYIIDEGLSKAISHYFNGKLHTFPIYKISLKLNRNPVKIPWTLGEPSQDQGGKMIYKYIPRKKGPEIKTV